MKKIQSLIILTLLFCHPSFADTKSEFNTNQSKEKKRANYVLTNMQQDYTTCYIFYKIGADAFRKSDGETNIVKGLEQSADISLKFAFETGEMLGMKIETMHSRVKLEMDSQRKQIKKNYSNISILLEKYGKVCKNLIKNKKQRISFWEKKAEKKFNE